MEVGLSGLSLFQAAFEDVDGFIGMFFLLRPSKREAVQFSTGALEEALAEAEVRAQNGYDAYFSPAPLRSKLEGGRRGSKEDYLGSKLLWVDLDAKRGMSKEQTVERVTSFTPTPSFVVDSGHGVHAYWALDHFETNHTAIEHRNLWLANQLGGDHCHSIDHLLRVPGTLNWKQKV